MEPSPDVEGKLAQDCSIESLPVVSRSLTTSGKSEKLRDTSGKLFDAACEGLHETHLAKLIIGLRTPDYGPLMPTMLATLDRAYQSEEHYQGWAWHSYGDALR